MESKEQYIQRLCEKFMRGALTSEEERELHEWYAAHDDWGSEEEDSLLAEGDAIRKRVYSKIQQNIVLPESKRIRPRGIAAAAAASVAFFVLVGVVALNLDRFNQPEKPAFDPLPAEQLAYLTVSDGRTIKLSEAQDGIQVINGQICYSDGTPVTEIGEMGTASSDNAAVTWLTISTPNRAEYVVQLADGSKIWLNAGSTLKYPVIFDSTERVVEFEGEGYFEIQPQYAQHKSNRKKDRKRIPFIVQMKNQRVEVLGTTFNIEGYAEDDFVETTLLEGSVRVTPLDLQGNRIAAPQILEPSQEALLIGHTLQVRQADVSSAIAWREGLFYFRDTPIHQLLKQVERWYDIDVDYETLPRIHYTGEIDRHLPLSKLLEMLQKAGDLEFEFKDNTLYGKTKN